MTAIDILGAAGAAALAVSGVPQAWLAIRMGHARGVALGTIHLWLWGELAVLLYVLARHPSDWILMANYLGNFLIVAVLARYAHRPRVGA